MSPEFRSLLLKEWAERRSLFRLGLVLVAVLLGYCVAYELEYRTRALIASYYSTCLMMSPLAAVLLAMSTATGEYSRRTLKFSSSLPVSLSKVAWARLLGAWGCLVVPIVCGAIVLTPLFAAGLFEQAGMRSDTVRLPDRPSLSRVAAIGFLWTTTAISVAYVLHLSTLLSLVGTRCRDEGTIGFIGAIVVLFTMIFTEIRSTLDSLGQFFVSDWIGALLPASLAINWGYLELDGSSYADLELAPLVFGPLAVNLLITASLATWFTRWSGCRADAVSRPTKSWRRWLPRIGMPAIAARLGIRWPGRLAALTWLNARQSVPLSVTGLMIAVLITWVGLLETQASGTLRVTEHGGTMASELMGQLPSSTWFVGALWAAIVAVGIFSSELKPGLEQFWRSRPISPGAWFWMKFSVGLIAVVGILDVIPAWLAWSLPRPEYVSHPSGPTNLSAYLACMPLIHAQVYAVAVAAVCRLRRPILAAIVALLVFFVVDSVLKSIPGFDKLSTIDVFNSLDQAGKSGERLDLTSAGYPIVYGIVVTIIIGATVLARRSLLPPRSSRRVAATAILLGLCGIATAADAHAAEPPTVADILAGIKQREALVKNVRMRLSSKSHKTAAFFSQQQATEKPRRRTGTASLSTEIHELIYELIDRPPRRAWSEFAPDATLKYWIAFDGTHLRQFFPRQSSRSARMTSPTTPAIPFIEPASALMSNGGTSLADLLISGQKTGEQQLIDANSGHLIGWQVTDVVPREVNGEQLIDFRLTQTIHEITGVAANGRDVEHASREYRYLVTVNATRHHWPVRVTLEVAAMPEAKIISRTETTAEGWLDAGPLAYPRQVTQRNYIARPSVNPPSATNPQHDEAQANSPPLELTLTTEIELQEIAVNTDLPDALFAPAFPSGTVFHDQQDRKQYEVTADGREQLYVPKPKGLRGAVFAYHLLWIASAMVWLFRRNAGL